MTKVINHIDKTDLADTHYLASGYFEWIAKLIRQAKQDGDQIFLDIAEYLAESQSDDFLQKGKDIELS